MADLTHSQHQLMRLLDHAGIDSSIVPTYEIHNAYELGLLLTEILHTPISPAFLVEGIPPISTSQLPTIQSCGLSTQQITRLICFVCVFVDEAPQAVLPVFITPEQEIDVVTYFLGHQLEDLGDLLDRKETDLLNNINNPTRFIVGLEHSDCIQFDGRADGSVDVVIPEGMNEHDLDLPNVFRNFELLEALENHLGTYNASSGRRGRNIESEERRRRFYRNRGVGGGSNTTTATTAAGNSAPAAAAAGNNSAPSPVNLPNNHSTNATNS